LKVIGDGDIIYINIEVEAYGELTNQRVLFCLNGNSEASCYRIITPFKLYDPYTTICLCHILPVNF